MILHVFKKITYHYCTIFSITNLLFYSTLICLNFRFYLENWSKATMGNKLPLLWFGLQGYLIKSGGGGTTSVLLRKTNFFICHQFHGKKTLWLMIIFFLEHITGRISCWPNGTKQIFPNIGIVKRRSGFKAYVNHAS